MAEVFPRMPLYCAAVMCDSISDISDFAQVGITPDVDVATISLGLAQLTLS